MQHNVLVRLPTRAAFAAMLVIILTAGSHVMTAPSGPTLSPRLTCAAAPLVRG
jgi:hypothetical protein